MTDEEIARICDEEGFDCAIVATMLDAEGRVVRVGFTIPLVASETTVRKELQIAFANAARKPS